MTALEEATNCWTYLVEHAAVVRGNIAGVHEEAFLHYRTRLALHIH